MFDDGWVSRQITTPECRYCGKPVNVDGEVCDDCEYDPAAGLSERLEATIDSWFERKWV